MFVSGKRRFEDKGRVPKQDSIDQTLSEISMKEQESLSLLEICTQKLFLSFRPMESLQAGAASIKRRRGGERGIHPTLKLLAPPFLHSPFSSSSF